MIKTLLFSVVVLAVSGLNWIAVPETCAQTPAASPAADAQNNEPLQMIIDYGRGNQKRRESRHGLVEAVGVPIGQQVTITLQFLRKRAGERIAVGALDGGAIDLAQPATISPDGSVTFGFDPGNTTGLHRLVIYGGQQHEINLYAFDPNSSRPSPRP